MSMRRQGVAAQQTQPSAAQPDGARPPPRDAAHLRGSAQHVASSHAHEGGCFALPGSHACPCSSFIAMSPQSLLSTWTQACPLCPGSHDHGDNTRGDQHVLGACLSPLRGGQPRKENSLSSDAPFDRGQKNRISGLSHITGALSTRQ